MTKYFGKDKIFCNDNFIKMLMVLSNDKPLVVFALHKPRGMTCDLSIAAPPNPHRPKDMKTWFDCLAPNLRHIGRLDKATTGLLLATNTDGGAFTARLLTPGNVSKTYVATVRVTNTTEPTKEQISTLLTNIELSDGPAHFDDVQIIERYATTFGEHTRHECDLQVVIRIGKNRIVRRLLAAAGLPVRALRRISIGQLHLRDLNLANTSDSARLNLAEIGRLWEGSSVTRVTSTSSTSEIDDKQSGVEIVEPAVAVSNDDAMHANAKVVHHPKKKKRRTK